MARAEQTWNLTVSPDGALTLALEYATELFDPETIGPWKKEFAHDLPGGIGRVKAWGKGVKATIVNGTPIVMDGVLLDALPGQVVSPQ